MDRALDELARSGDEAAFARLADEIGGRLYSIAFHILRDAAAADDAAQQALIGIWRHLPELQEIERFDAWSYRIVVREAYAEARRGRRSWPSLGIIASRGIDRHADDDIERLTDRDRIERGFCRLSAEQRAVMVLKHFVGLGDDEMADVLGVPVGTIRSRLFYGMRTLRAAIDADERPTIEDFA